MANIKVKFKEAYQDFGAYALLKNVTDKGVLIVDGTEVLNSIADLPTTNTVDGQEKAVIVQNGQVITTSINNIGGETGNVFIPLTGTEVGKPVTGDIEIDGTTVSNNGFKIYTGDIDDIGRSFRFTDDGYCEILNNNISNGYNSSFSSTPNAIVLAANDSIYIQALELNMNNSDGITVKDTKNNRGLTGIYDYTSNITDLDYTQKIYVDTHIAFTPIPTSSTDPGIKGQMAIDATYLYICVDTDTLARVALTW